MKQHSVTVGQRVRQLLAAKRAKSYKDIAAQVRRELRSGTTVDSVQWYASQMRREGETPNVRLTQ